MLNKKVCKRCMTEKSLSEFYGEKKNKDGLRLYCKSCDKEPNRLTYKKNKDIKKNKLNPKSHV